MQQLLLRRLLLVQERRSGAAAPQASAANPGRTPGRPPPVSQERLAVPEEEGGVKIRLVISKTELIKAIAAQYLNQYNFEKIEAESINWWTFDQTLEIELITSEDTQTAGVPLTSASPPVIDPPPTTVRHVDDDIPL